MFTGKVRAEWQDDGMTMRLLDPVSFTDSNGREWIAEAGFVTDGASIPQALWSLVGSPFTGRYRVAAVLHDAAYRTPGIPKAQADLMLRDAALALGCPHWLAEAIYAGVTIGGAGPYADDQYDAAIVLARRVETR